MLTFHVTSGLPESSFLLRRVGWQSWLWDLIFRLTNFQTHLNPFRLNFSANHPNQKSKDPNKRKWNNHWEFFHRKKHIFGIILKQDHIQLLDSHWWFLLYWRHHSPLREYLRWLHQCLSAAHAFEEFLQLTIFRYRLFVLEIQL